MFLVILGYYEVLNTKANSIQFINNNNIVIEIHIDSIQEASSITTISSFPLLSFL